MGRAESLNLKNDYERACGWYGHSTRAKWRSSPSARIGMLKICLTPPTLSEKRFCNSYDEQDVILLEDRGCSTKPEILYRDMGFCHCHVRRPCVSSHRLDTSPACSEDERFATAGWPS